MKQLPLLFFLLFSFQLFAQDIVLTGVRIMDVERGKALPPQSVLICNGRIAAIGKKVQASPTAQVVNTSGQYLIPGLWDAHFHMRDNIDSGWVYNEKISLPLLLANGVTGVRYMAGNAGLLAQRNRVNEGTLLGPKMLVSTPILQGRPTREGFKFYIRDTAHARRSIDSMAALGYDLAKVYTCWPDRAVFNTVAEACKRNGLPFGGHVPATLNIHEAAESGMYTMEHLHSVREAFTDIEDSLVAMNASVCITRRNLFTALDSITSWMAQHYSPAAGKRTVALFKKYQVYQTSTSVVTEMVARLGNMDSLLHDSLFAAYTPPALQARFVADNKGAADVPSLMKAVVMENKYAARVNRDLYRWGAPMLVGTDAPNLALVPGFSMHTEMQNLQAMSIRPAQILKAATFNAAKAFRIDKDYGSVQVGKVADLVLLEANPLQDIRNTKRIVAVVTNGKLFNRTQLDALLTNVRASVAEPPSKN